jgi:putative addiction module killer protein
LHSSSREILICQREDGSEPFSEWLKSLDPITRARVRNRLDHVEDGNLGVHKSVGKGVVELVLDFGPGFRIYIGQLGNEVHLISGGSKRTQQRDIRYAQRFWSEHQ